VAAQQTAGVVNVLYNFARDTPAGKQLPVDDMPSRGVEFKDLSKDQPAMTSPELAPWYVNVRALPEAIHQEVHVFGQLSGLRPSEVLNLQWKDLDLKTRDTAGKRTR